MLYVVGCAGVAGKITEAVVAHDNTKDRAVTAMTTYSSGVVTGSNDNTIKFWDSHLKSEHVIDLGLVADCVDAKVY